MPTQTAATFDALCAQVNVWMQQYQVPGVAVGVLADGAMYSAGFGVTNVDHPLLVTDETLFQIGSITKTFEATLIMRLVEAGTLNLDAPVRTYLPGFKLRDEEVAARVTVRHLLTHTGGWPGDLFIDTGDGDDAAARYMARMAELQQAAPLGKVFSYNNAGFYLAGHLIETVTQRSFADAVAEWVLGPLALEQCYLRPTDVMTLRFASGHRVQDGVAVVARPWSLPRAAWAVGGIITNVKELLRYARFHMGDGKREDGAGLEAPQALLTPASLRQMQSPQFPIWRDKEAVGLAWMLNDVDGFRRVSHSGGTVGQISQLALAPERGFALAVVTNCERGGELTQAAYRWCAEHFLGVKPWLPIAQHASMEKLAQYTGQYAREGVDAELRLENGQLKLHLAFTAGFPTEDTPPPPAPPPAVLDLCEEDRLIVVDGAMKDMLIDVIRDEHGQIRWVRSGRVFNPVRAAGEIESTPVR